jgi:hypothetical protein
MLSVIVLSVGGFGEVNHESFTLMNGISALRKEIEKSTLVCLGLLSLLTCEDT